MSTQNSQNNEKILTQEIHGDIIEVMLSGGADLLVHGCNCFCTMGKGLAKDIKKIFPNAYEADLATTKGDKTKLGKYSYADNVNKAGDKIRIINAYTQYNYAFYGDKTNKDLFEYEAFDKILTRLNQQYPGKRIAFPQIGAGLAGGDWGRIKRSIETLLPDMQVVIVYYQTPQLENKFKPSK